GLAVAEAYARREAYADARKVVPLVRAAAAGGRNPVVQARVRDRLARIEQAASDADRAKVAADKLKADPKDPEANLTAGRYRALVRGDFAAGLPLLAAGRDPNLKAAAAADLAGPTTPDARKAAGDLWWEQAAREAASPAAADACRDRAGHWYRLAEPGLIGLAKAGVKQRLESLPPPPAGVSESSASSASSPGNAAAAAPWLAVGTLESRKPPVLAKSAGLVPFKVPNHDQWWTGSNGVLVRPGPAWERVGTVWFCPAHTRRPWGVRFVHPFKDGHVLVSLGEKVVEVQAGGAWREKGRNVQVTMTPEAQGLFPIPRDTACAIRSELLPDGTFRLLVNDKLVATARIDEVRPLEAKDGFVGEGMPGPFPKGAAAAVIDHAYHMGNSVAADLSLCPSPGVAGPAPGGRAGAAAPARTEAAGGKGGGDFEDLAPPGGVLIGLTAHTVANNTLINRVTPIFSTPDRGQVAGNPHGIHGGDERTDVARDGYAVGGVIVGSGARIDGFSVVFMRRTAGGRLDPNDSYVSDWVGGKGGGERRLGGTGDPVIGVFGGAENWIDRLGLVTTSRL
ncbi:MAG TPA: hypothetical protein VF796_03815, partial [Humisphaera sp.]